MSYYNCVKLWEAVVKVKEWIFEIATIIHTENFKAK